MWCELQRGRDLTPLLRRALRYPSPTPSHCLPFIAFTIPGCVDESPASVTVTHRSCTTFLPPESLTSADGRRPGVEVALEGSVA